MSEENFPPIVLGAHSEVNPVGRASLLLDQFVKFPAVLVGRVKQDAGVADHLFRACAADVYGAARQMIGALRPTAKSVNFLRTIP